MASAQGGVAGYRIADEPTPGALARLTVNPFWPMLATMLAGSWLGAPWFVFNAFALGSATRRRESAWAVGSVLVSAALAYGVLFADAQRLAPLWTLRGGLVLVAAARLTGAYFAYLAQSASFELHRHFGGPVVNGAPLALLGFLLPTGQVWTALQPRLGEAATFFLRLVLG
jgi:hypothetical protein